MNTWTEIQINPTILRQDNRLCCVAGCCWFEQTGMPCFANPEQCVVLLQSYGLAEEYDISLAQEEKDGMLADIEQLRSARDRQEDLLCAQSEKLLNIEEALRTANALLEKCGLAKVMVKA